MDGINKQSKDAAMQILKGLERLGIITLVRETKNSLTIKFPPVFYMEDDMELETAPLIFPWTDEAFLSAWQLWKDYKKEQFGFIYKPKGEQAALKNLSEIASGYEGAVRIIHRSMGNGWKGLFAPTGKEQKADYQVKASAWANDVLKRHGLEL